ncbi:MAG: helix-turn-helix transcriptional regulator [Proteobacteria bacterium]|nr:helix-turn-helix transcriptional regulator [Pseudomonadota bacterium]
MRVYREMPATWDPVFRQSFYRQWGRESAIICAHSRRAEYPLFRQLLSIKAVVNGAEDYFIDGRHLAVDQETFLILNEDRCYSSNILSLQPVYSFSIFFDRALVNNTWSLLRYTGAELLEDPQRRSPTSPEFAERLYHHDKLVSPALAYIRQHIEAGIEDEMWLEEHLSFLLQRMLRLQYNLVRQQHLIRARKGSTRREVERRLARGVDFICTHFREPITLAQIAAAAQLSPYYFLRQFRSVYGCSPGKYIQRRRCRAALELLRKSTWTMAEIAEEVGFGTRSSLCRRIKAEFGVEPRNLRPMGA